MGNNQSAVPVSPEDSGMKPDKPAISSASSPGSPGVDTSTIVNEEAEKIKQKAPPVVFGFQLNDETRQLIKSYRTPIATSLASVSSTLIAYPLDFVKARMQSYNTRFLPTLIEAYRHEGIRGMYKGCVTPIYTIAFVRTISFPTYQRAKYGYDAFSRQAFGVSPLESANAKGQYPNIHTFTCFALSGAAAGAVIPIFAAPFELLKLKSQLAAKMNRDAKLAATAARTIPITDVKTGTWGPALQMCREHGVFSLWKGGLLHLGRDTLGTAIYFSTYEAVKQTLANAQGHDPTDPKAAAIAGGLCGVMSWIFIYPIDVVKTQYQARFLSGDHTTGSTKINFLNRAGYRGLPVSIARSGVINAIFFPIFERYKRSINGL